MIAKEFYKLQVDIQLEEEVVDQGSPLPYHYKLAIEMIEGRKDRGAIGSMLSVYLLDECNLTYEKHLFIVAYTHHLGGGDKIS